METAFVALASVLTGSIGAIASWLYNHGRSRSEREALEDHMRKQIEERYAAYLDLESRISCAILAFDRREREFQRKLSEQTTSIEDLKKALDEHEGLALQGKDTDFLGLPFLMGDARPAQDARPPEAPSAPAADEPEFEPAVADAIEDALASLDDWMGETEFIDELPADAAEPADPIDLARGAESIDAEIAAIASRALDEIEAEAVHAHAIDAPIPAAADAAPAVAEPIQVADAAEAPIAAAQEEALAQMDEWELKLEAGQEERTAEVERQSEQIAAMADQIKRLEPLSETVFKREQEIESWKRRYADLESALASQTRAMDRCLEELVPKANDLSDNEATIRSLRERFQERLKEKQDRIDDLERRVRGFEGEASRTMDELAHRQAEVASLAVRCVELERASDGAVADLESRVRELEPLGHRVADLAETNAKLEAELSARGGALAELTRKCEEQAQRLERSSHEHERSIAAVDELRGELDRTRCELEELRSIRSGLVERIAWQDETLAAKQHELEDGRARLQELGEHLAELEGRLHSTSESLDGEKTRIGELMRELDDAHHEAEAQGTTLSEAQSVLDALRPMIQTLEKKLRR